MKRALNIVDGQGLLGTQKASKMQKRQHKPRQNSPTTSQNIPVKSREELRNLVLFDQTLQIPEIITRFRNLTSYLKSIEFMTDSHEKLVRQNQLRCLFESETRTQTRKGLGSVDDLCRYWRFSTQLDNQHVYCLTANAIAALLRAISDNLDLSTHGNALCHSLLEEPNVSCFEKGLGAHSTNVFLAESCLRLLTEILAFDGGQSANLVHARRETTLSNLSRFLDVASLKSREQPRIRSVALKYFMTTMKLYSRKAKIEALHERRVIKAVFQGLSNDKSGQITELLETIRRCVLVDVKISIIDKRRFLDASSLKILVGLYKTPNQEFLDKSRREVPEAVHRFLIEYCNMSMLGERASNGTNVDDKEEVFVIRNSAKVQATYDFSTNQSSYAIHRDSGIVSLLSYLKPHIDHLQRDLLLHILNLDPGMVTDYFKNQEAFALDPKLTATWMGYYGLLTSIVQMPVPLHRLRRIESMQARVDLLVDHITPFLLSRHALNRCINSSTQLLCFLGVQLATASLQKLLHVSKLVGSQDDIEDEEDVLEKGIVLQVKSKVCQRLPEIKTIILAFQRYAAEVSMRKEALARLLRLYYAVYPRNTFREMFDVSHTLSETLHRYRSSSCEVEVFNTDRLVLNNLFQIAMVTPSAKWWSRSGEFSHNSLLVTSIKSFRYASNISFHSNTSFPCGTAGRPPKQHFGRPSQHCFEFYWPAERRTGLSRHKHTF